MAVMLRGSPSQSLSVYLPWYVALKALTAGVFTFEMPLVEGEMICFLKNKKKLKKEK